MHWKDRLKKVSLINDLNARIKEVQLRRGLKAIARQYESKLYAAGISYDEERAVKTFRKRLHEINPKYLAKPLGEVQIFWVGASQAQDESGFLQALRGLGRVSVFKNSAGGYGALVGDRGVALKQVRLDNDEALVRQVTDVDARSGVDILIGQMWAHQFSPAALLRVRALGIPVINIAMDDRLPIHWLKQEGIRMGSVGLGAGVDIVLTTSPETCSWYAAEHMPALFWPLASDAGLFAASPDAARDINVLFIGNRYGIRGKIVEYLSRQGIAVDCYGGGWPNGYVNAEQNVALSRRAKIILGVGTVGHCSDVYTLKLRDFDALMTGALYITHRNPDLLRIFTEGEHLECYASNEELSEKLFYYLQHPAECASIGKKGQALAMAEHTWTYRLSGTFRRLGLAAS